MAKYEVIVCDPNAVYADRSVIMSAPANHIECVTSQGTPGNLKAVQVVLDEIDFSALGISSAQIGTAFGFGFGAVVLFWFFGYCIGVAVDLIRKV